MLKSIILAALVACCSLSNQSYAQSYFPTVVPAVPSFGRCITPNLERGLCIILQDCEYLFSVLQRNPLLEADRLYLSKSQCGYQNRKVLICCPDRYRDLSPSRPTTVSPTVPVATNGNTNSLLPLPGRCGNVLSNRIFGGNMTKIDEYPWLALIEYTKPGDLRGHHCGGSLINQRYVLTASHCVNGKGLPTDWKLSGVRLGEWDTTTSPDCDTDVRGHKDCAPEHLDIPVERTIPHPQYDPNDRNQANDIALLRLKDNVVYSDFVQPICLPINQNLRVATFDGISMDVAGWGKTETESASTIKLKAAVDGFPLDKCRSVYGQHNLRIGESQLCAGGREGVDSCRGDSGGPLISLDTTNKVRVYYFLAGVVSFGPTPCGLDGWPGVYTRVGSFVDWIQMTIEP